MAYGYIYVLSNPSIPGLLKIGRTDRTPEERIRELHSTGVPAPFKIEHSRVITDSRLTETMIHDALTAMGARPSVSREFFSISLGDAVEVVERICNQFDIDMSGKLTRQKWMALYQQFIGIKQLDFSQELSHKEAEVYEARLSAIGEAGYAIAFQFLTFIFDRNSPAGAKFKDYSQRFLLATKRELDELFELHSEQHRRKDYGKEIANYLDMMFRKKLLIDSDFKFVSDILVSADRYVYDGYINMVNHPGFPSAIKQKAADV